MYWALASTYRLNMAISTFFLSKCGEFGGLFPEKSFEEVSSSPFLSLQVAKFRPRKPPIIILQS
jgi:hypothetical protein